MGGLLVVKTLTVSIDDVNKEDRISIAGTLNETEFNKAVVITIGQNRVVVDSQELALALAHVVGFQSITVPPVTTP